MLDSSPVMKIGFVCWSLSCLCLVVNSLCTPVSADIDPVNRSQSQQSKVCPQDLPDAIAAVINRPELTRSRWGIEVQTLKGESLYSLEGNKLFVPASSAKLLVSAAGLKELGANYRIKTPIYGAGAMPNLTSLRVEGRGDPTITTKSLKNIVHQLQLKGVKQIENLIVDDRYFPRPLRNSTWEWLDVHSYYATAVNSAILNQNSVTLTLLPQEIGQAVKFAWQDSLAGRQWRVVNQAVTAPADSKYAIALEGDLGKPELHILGELAVNEPPDVWDLAVVNPPQYFLDGLRSQLELAGISVIRGEVVDALRDSQDSQETELAAIYSPPLSQLLIEINRESNNLYAEVLGKLLAKKLGTENSIEALDRSLSALGIAPKEYVLEDASGLSRQNLITPQTLVGLLNLVARSSDAQPYRDTLAIAGVNGTLKRRYANTSVRGNLWGKTGTLTGVGTLTGYLQTTGYSTLVFSIVVNNSDLPSSKIRQAIDEVVVILNHLQVCPRSVK